jgi:catalase-peroxidase
MGLIYVIPKVLTATRTARRGTGYCETFARMAMNDEETVALIAGGHSFGKTHGAGDVKHVGREPKQSARGAGLGLDEQLWHRRGADSIGSGLKSPDLRQRSEQRLFAKLFGYEWELTKSPAGAHQF